MELSEIFEKQAELNNIIMEKQKIQRVWPDDFLSVTDLSANGDANHWLSKLSTALKDEVRELDEELLWKWWSKDSIDMQNIRVEIIDIFHFWISMAMAAGMTPADVERIYCQKYQVNIDRQNNGYCAKTKTEDDNLRIS